MRYLEDSRTSHRRYGTVFLSSYGVSQCHALNPDWILKLISEFAKKNDQILIRNSASYLIKQKYLIINVEHFRKNIPYLRKFRGKPCAGWMLRICLLSSPITIFLKL